MKLLDVDRETEVTFLHCLHYERSDDARVMELRRNWYEAHVGKGLRAKVLRVADRKLGKSMDAYRKE